ncbi:MAG: DUF58 domain-containing protein [Pseudomonadota bacterium]
MSDAAQTGLNLRAEAEALSGGFPGLMAAAENLASMAILGPHGRRRPGMGTEFWQYRAAKPEDGLRDIDWRRSARSDERFVRQTELQVAQSLSLWVDQGASMDFASDASRHSKAFRAEVLGVAAALLMAKAGERVGLLNDAAPTKIGLPQVEKMALELALTEREHEYHAPEKRDLRPGSHVLFLSDFLGDWDQIIEGLSNAAQQKVNGILVQVLDPIEEEFPFSRRVLFESVGGGLQFETKQAGSLRDRFLQRLHQRQSDLRDLARNTGWQVMFHRTDRSALDALQWIFFAMEKR